MRRTFPFCGLCSALIGVCSTLVGGEAAQASQVVIQEVTYTHAPATTHDSHYTLDALPANPPSWTSPVDYTKGTVVVRLEVFTKPSDAPTRLQICFEGNPYSCTLQSATYYATGIYTWTSRFDQFYSPGTPSYVTSPEAMSLILKDDMNVKPAPENVGATQAARYMPTELRVTVTLVSAGATYEPPAPTPVEPSPEPDPDPTPADPPPSAPPAPPPVGADPTPVAEPREPDAASADALDLDHLDVNGGCAAVDGSGLASLVVGMLAARRRVGSRRTA